MFIFGVGVIQQWGMSLMESKSGLACNEALLGKGFEKIVLAWEGYEWPASHNKIRELFSVDYGLAIWPV